ncbi:LacI family transcriptional regulator [Flagellimonas sp. HMM57]|uniref:LacI family DNA-binding transcriptional regulator n=1 Tax=unclassified Flagellimonas TaxID=2644544 RepID=UPI0013D85604|nr:MULTISPECIES: LacI family DNA-binding transcriptional regulator [unclassified Flagellimonas]UII77199.1 LacI family transcriptional regulator [Flagellimonas sp. HMM57]
MATIKDIAELANVSVSTVSKALNDSPEIGSQTSAKIKAIARELGYVPNSAAVALKRSATHHIGIIVPEISSEFFSKLVQAIETSASKRGFKSVLCFSKESFMTESQIIQNFCNGSVDGIIISMSKQTQQLRDYKHILSLMDHGIPVVMVDRTCDSIECEKVRINDFGASEHAVEHLIATGCKKPAFISTIPKTNVGKERKKGYRSAIQQKLYENNAKGLVLELNGYRNFEKELDSFIQQNAIDGILAANELAAIKAMNIIKKKGLQIPEDVSVIGFTDGQLSQHSSPSLTSISQNANTMGAIALKRLLFQITRDVPRPNNHIQTVVKHKLILRESTKAIH